MATYGSDRAVVKLDVRSRDVHLRVQSTRTHHLLGSSDHTADPETNEEINTRESSLKAKEASEAHIYGHSKTIYLYTVIKPNII
jgi:hypothetical protein